MVFRLMRSWLIFCGLVIRNMVFWFCLRFVVFWRNVLLKMVWRCNGLSFLVVCNCLRDLMLVVLILVWLVKFCWYLFRLLVLICFMWFMNCWCWLVRWFFCWRICWFGWWLSWRVGKLFWIRVLMCIICWFVFLSRLVWSIVIFNLFICCWLMFVLFLSVIVLMFGWFGIFIRLLLRSSCLCGFWWMVVSWLIIISFILLFGFMCNGICRCLIS